MQNTVQMGMSAASQQQEGVQVQQSAKSTSVQQQGSATKPTQPGMTRITDWASI
ncbi:hypothetical protein SAMN05877809_10784 [Rhodobacter sp. JA431]|uniref:hypothetical protein n=1 Tax=Rhodobacter sp. JA431 TaxID=570013 RepID=UPI000BCB25CC|nr:hypothetical protein [Rhodobacter sp. JA431]SOC14161.1 hypothetical protein SAMN05877809_10784 [Rhodobacter sp. JA431]